MVHVCMCMFMHNSLFRQFLYPICFYFVSLLNREGIQTLVDTVVLARLCLAGIIIDQ